MKILHCIPSLDLRYGGPSQSAASLMSHLAELPDRSAEVSVMCEPMRNAPGLSARVHAYPVTYMSTRYWVPDRRSVHLLRSAVRTTDVVHVHSYWNAFASIAVREALAAGRPVVMSPRGSLHRDAIGFKSGTIKKVFGALVGNRQLARLSGFHFQSQEEAAHSYKGIAPRQAPEVIVDNGVEVPELDVSPQEARLRTMGSDGAIHLLFFGRLNRIKGVHLQLQALQLLRSGGLDAHLHLVGPDDGALQELKVMAEGLGVASQLHVHGPVFGAAKHLWLRGAHAVLMSSKFENNSNAALEVMAAQGVLVATEASISPAAGDAGAAFRVEASPEGIAQAVVRLAADDALSGRVRTRAVEFVRSHHHWGSRARKVYDFYRSLT